MKKSELMKLLAVETSGSVQHAEKLFDALCKQIQNSLAAGDEISLPGVGKLKVVNTDARTARNPRTGTVFEVPAGRKVRFTRSAKLKELM